MLLIEDVPNDELALMQRLGMPPDSPWIWLSCPEPVTPTALNVTLRLRDRTCQVEQVRPSSALADWYGLSFEVFGRSIFEAQRTKGHPLWRLGGDAVIEAWHARAFNVAEGIEAVAIWKPPAAARLVISAGGRRWSAEATAKARAAVHALQEFERAAGGRHRIGDDPSDGELAMARQAERLQREHPTWTWRRIVFDIRLVEAIEDEGRSNDPEAAALERLRRWRKRLREIGE